MKLKMNSTEVFNNFKDKKEILIKQRQLKEQQIIENLSKDFEVTPSGLRYKILNKGNGDSPTKGDKVKVHYKGMLIDETVLIPHIKETNLLNLMLELVK